METKAQNTTEKTKVFNVIILDKSGSMSSIRPQAIDGFNETLGGIRAAQLKYMDTQEHFVSLCTFCGCQLQMVYDCTPIKEAENLKPEQYTPCCMTPLYDAIGTTVTKIKKTTQDLADATVLITIITDGLENASKEWNFSGVMNLIKQCKEDGWMFSFIGAGQDLLEFAERMSISNTMLWKQTAEGTKKMFSDEMDSRSRYLDKLNACAPCGCDMSNEERISMKKKLAEDYYTKN